MSNDERNTKIREAMALARSVISDELNRVRSAGGTVDERMLKAATDLRDAMLLISGLKAE